MKDEHIIIVLLLVVFVALVVSIGQPSEQQSDGPDLKAIAQATSAAQLAKDQAELRAIEIEKKRAEVAAIQNAIPAATIKNVLLYLAVGGGAVVLCVGLSLALVRLVQMKASLIKSEAGLFPLLVKKQGRDFVIHNPNSALSSTFVLSSSEDGATIIKSLDSNEAAQLQITTQAQAVQLFSAGMLPDGKVDTTRLISDATSKAFQSPPPQQMKLRVVDSQEDAIALLIDEANEPH